MVWKKYAERIELNKEPGLGVEQAIDSLSVCPNKTCQTQASNFTFLSFISSYNGNNLGLPIHISGYVNIFTG